MNNDIKFDVIGFKKFQEYAFTNAITGFINLGILGCKAQNQSIDEVRKSLNIIDNYKRLFEEVIRQIAEEKGIRYYGTYTEALATIFIEANTRKSSISKTKLVEDFPHIKITVEFLEVCMQHFVAILQGEKLATDIIFPEGRMDIVEGVYRENPYYEYLNNTLSEEVAQLVAKYINESGKTARTIRILEIGAGTGGTSQSVFEKLKSNIEFVEYTYTDISKSFLIHAEKTFKSIVPNLKTALLNVEKPIQLQGFKLGAYDIIIAANVLHATKDIAKTLAHTNSLLKTEGMLFLNEVTITEMFTTLTFGLLEGWWLYEDEELRLQGSPALSVENWTLALGEQGFDLENVLPDSEEFSQKIIIAQRNNQVLSEYEEKPQVSKNQHVEIKVKQANIPSDAKTVKKNQNNKSEVHATSEKNSNYIENQLIAAVSEVLNISNEEVDKEDQFSDYGLDSILGTKFLKSINDKLQVTLEITDIFSYPNIIALSEFILENHHIVNEIKEEVELEIANTPRIENQQMSFGKETENQATIPYIESQLVAAVSEVLNISNDEVDKEDQFSDYGLDSILGTKFLKSINDKLDVVLEITDIFSYSNIKALAIYIDDSFSIQPATSEFTEEAAFSTEQGHQEKEITEEPILKVQKAEDYQEAQGPERTYGDEIAIVGMSGQFGATNNLEEFWDAIEKGESLITEVPEERWDVDTYFSPDRLNKNKTYSKWGSFIKNIDKFDPLFFKISGKEAENMDPQQRLFLEHCWQAIEDAGILPTTLSETKCGVYVSAAPSDYRSHLKEQDVSSFSGTANSILSARISYLLNLKGPALTIDTACSSSMVAMHLAAESLRSGESDVMISGGVHIQSTPGFYINTSRAGMLSPTGQCYAFDNRANGFVPGEGVGIVIMKRLKDAVASGDQIYGVIKGSGINQDGTTNGIMAPNILSQQSLETEVYKKYNINPETIKYAEAHGTGTKLGDPIEFKALNQSFRTYTDKVSYCALGSVKSNIGHTIMTAGVAGVLKVLLAIKNKRIPAACNFENINENISIEGSPFYINTAPEDWESSHNEPRRASVSSFGFSGTNAHMVLEEYLQPEKATTKERFPILIPISAKSKDRLKAYAHQLIQFITKKQHQHKNINLLDIGWTLQIGRQPMQERLVLVVNSIEQLVQQLNNYVSGISSKEVNIFAGNIGETKNSILQELVSGVSGDLYIKNVIQEKDYVKLSQLWVEGVDVSWALLYEGRTPSKISLPTYPFDKQSYWLPDEALEPLENTSHTIEGKTIITSEEKSIQLKSNTINELNSNNQGVVYVSHEWISKKVLIDVDIKNQKKYVILAQGIEKTNFESLDVEIITLKNGEPANCFNTVFDLLQKVVASANQASIVLVYNNEDRVKYGFIASLFRTASIENPNIRGKILGVDTSAKADVTTLLQEFRDKSIDVQYITKDRKVRQHQEVMLPISAKLDATEVIRESGVFLITGGMGGLGKLFAKHIIETYPNITIILTGRSEINAEYRAVLRELKQAEYIRCDISNKEEVAALISEIKTGYGALNGIIHAAGLGAMSLIKDSKEDIGAYIFPAKIDGIINLDALTKSEPLDFVMYFSSISSVLGIPGMSHYGAANAFMDIFSEHRNAKVSKGERFGKTISINWPFWEGGGMQIEDIYQEALYLRLGIKVLPKEIGIKSFELILQESQSQVLAVYGNTDKIRQKIVNKNNVVAKDGSSTITDKKEFQKELTYYLKRQIVTILKIDEKAVLSDVPFGDFGFDSISLTELSNQINKKFNLELVPTIFYNYSSIQGLVKYLMTEHNLSGQMIEIPNNEKVINQLEANSVSNPLAKDIGNESSIQEQKNVDNTSSTNEPIAIIGISGRYPGAPDVSSFWEKLVQEEDLITEVPKDRWDWEAYYGDSKSNFGKTKVKWGGFIDDIDKFDPLFFNISPKEAKLMDPQQRLCLETVWAALEDAGIKGSDIAGTSTGIFVGVSANDYLALMQDEKLPLNGHVTTGTSLSMLVNRISYFLDTHGPSEPVDTACSSSLVAIKKAVDYISSGYNDIAIAGGVNAQLTPGGVLALSHAGMLSTEGRCKTFDASANGYVRSEGVGMVVLKKLSQAEADGDVVYGVIKAAVQNHGGKSNSLTAPNSKAQKDLIIAAYQSAGVSPDQINYIETHGTGTSLGDPIEIEGLQMAFKELYKDSKKEQIPHNCALGTVKTNVGHLESAAGVVSISKVLMAMKHNYLPGNIHLKEVNPYIQLKDSPFTILKEGKVWQSDNKRIAGVSGFGFGGVNAHIVLEEHISKNRDFNYKSDLKIIPLSAKNKNQLHHRATQLLAYIQKTNTDLPDIYTDEKELHSIAWTLQIGREPMEERLVLLVNSIEELVAGLQQYIKKGDATKNIYLGSIDSSLESVEFQDINKAINTTSKNVNADKIAQSWVVGTEINWRDLYFNNTPQKISLPTYPFEKTRYWFDKKTNEEAAPLQTVFSKNEEIQVSKDSNKIVLDAIANNEVSLQEFSTTISPKIELEILHSETSTITHSQNNKTYNLTNIQKVLKTLLSDALSLPVEQLKTTQKFIDLGLDSILGVELIKEINKEFNLNLSATDVYDHPTIDKLSDFLLQSIQENSDSKTRIDNQSNASVVRITEEIEEGDMHLNEKTSLQSVAPPLSENIPSYKEIEDKLLLLFCEATELDKLTVAKNHKFSDLGLDSILGVELIKEINNEFRLNLSATDLYDYPTIDKLTLFLSQSLQGNNGSRTTNNNWLNDATLQPVAVKQEGSEPLSQKILLQTEAHISPGNYSAQKEVEEKLMLLFCEATELDKLTVAKNHKFSDLGLGSILGVELIKEINNEFNLNLSATDLYDYPTINKLTSFISSKLGASSITETSSVINASEQNFEKPLSGSYGYVIKSVEEIENVHLEKVEIINPSADEVQVEVKASSINFPDIMCVKGMYPEMPAYPFIPGFEVSGIVCKVGSNITDVSLGDPVIALTGWQMGGHASHVNVHRIAVAKKPSNITFEQASCLPVIFITIYQALQKANLKKGENILIQTASGGCGLMAVQLANLINAGVVGTSSRQNKRDFLNEIGVVEVANYNDPNFEENTLLKHKGFDVVINMLSGDLIQKGMNLLKSGGRYIELSVHGLKTSKPLDMSMMNDNQEFISINLRTLGNQGKFDIQAALNLMSQLIAEGTISPIVSKTYPLSRINEALKFVETGAHIGKVVISHQDSEVIDYTEQLIRDLKDQKSLVSAHYPKAITSQEEKIPVVGSEKQVSEIAIIGMSGKFPGSPDTSTFWDNLINARDLVTEAPISRWDVDTYFDTDPKAIGKTYSKWGGFVDDIDKFDPLFFNISPIEAEAMDPQQRLFLEESWKTFEDAGYAPEMLSGENCGIFIGAVPGDYSSRNVQSEEALDYYTLSGNASSILSARIAYLLDLKGPCLSIDTACSSSLVALTQACDSLVSGVSNMALTGGVFIGSTPGTHIMTSKAGMLSPDGKCHTFDKNANGFVPGEGVGFVLLKRLEEAERDGDNIVGVIKGWGVNQDGATNGITAPSVESQVKLETEVYQNFKIDPSEISYVEAHGTGTKLGDPIEVRALTKSFRKFTNKTNFCGIGSVKTNIGHAQTASGVASIIKVLLALKNEQIPPSLHYNHLNEHIDIARSPFFIADKAMDWKSNPSQPRKAAISSFGFSGTNAHIVIEEYLKSKAIARTSVAEVLIPVSAKNEERLQEYVKTLGQYVELPENQYLSLLDIAWTLQIGREAMEEKVAFVARDKEALRKMFQSYLNGEKEIKGVYRGSQETVSDFLVTGEEGDLFKQQVIIDKNYDKLASLWISGVTIDWKLLYSGLQPKKISLPTYPFARERYWVETSEIKKSTSNNLASTEVLHPLVHKNETTSKTLRCTTHFSGTEVYFNEHLVFNEPVLPGAAHLEIARFAGGVISETNINRITDIVWGNMIKSNKKALTTYIDFNTSADGGYAYEIYSLPNNHRNFHSQGRVHSGYIEPKSSIDIEAILNRLGNQLSEEQCYGVFAALGLNSGSIYRCIKKLHYNEKESLTYLERQHSEDGIELHVGMLDAVLQSVLGCFINKNQEEALVIPFSIQEIKIYAPLADKAYCYTRLSSGDVPNAKVRAYDVDITDASGNVLLEIKDYALREIEKPKVETSEPASLCIVPEWKAKAITPILDSEQTVGTKKLLLINELPGSDIHKLPIGLNTEVVQLRQTIPVEYWEEVFIAVKSVISTREKMQLLLIYPESAHHSYGFVIGLLKTAKIENPLLSIKTIGVQQQVLQSSNKLLEVIQNETNDDASEVRYTAVGRVVKKLKEQAIDDTNTHQLFKKECVYLIVGGMGGLGKVLAEQISKTTQSQLVLTGRSQLDDGQKTWLQRYPNVSYQRCDITDKVAVNQLINSIKSKYGRLKGIVQAAGVLHDSFILKKTITEAREVLASKIIGTINLDEATRNENLDFMMFFSSIAAVAGSIGQSDYAAANAFMDGYTEYRNQLAKQGLCTGKTMSINWPLWEEGGMQVDVERAKLAKENYGILALPTSEGIRFMESISATENTQAAIYYGNTHKLRKFIFNAETENNKTVAHKELNGKIVETTTTSAQPKTKSNEALEAKTLSYLKDLLTTHLKIAKEKLRADKPFEAYGIDSIMVIKLINVLEEQFGVLSKTLFFEYMNLGELSVYFSKTYPKQIEELFKDKETSETDNASPLHNEAVPSNQYATSFDRTLTPIPLADKKEKNNINLVSATNDIAIIGLSGKYPQANTINEFWENLKAGKDCITEIPKDRWDMDKYYDPAKGKEGKIYTKYGGFIDGVANFDPLFFNISPIEAELMDPQERLFLERAWETIEDAGYTKKTLKSSTVMDNVEGNVGVYVGVMYEEYPFFGVEGTQKGKSLVVSSNSSSIANRVSYFLDLKGPSMAVNTMCSSSLTSIHLACESIINGTCKMAIAGGVNVNIHPNKFVALSQGGFISQEGRCASFGQGGDGYAPSEGVGAVLLKPLSQAKLDGDRIYGVIKGSSLNHGGKTNGYTVPNPKAQANAIKSALTKAKIPVDSLSYIEAHGTGTSLGDPIEIAGLSQIFNKETNTCSIGSVKSNIGHTESASGIAGVTKILLQMQHKQLVPSIHSSALNPNIDFKNSPFEVQQSLRNWNRPVVFNDEEKVAVNRLAGVSSFGAGGSNAHIIIEEYNEEASTEYDNSTDDFVVICLSAKNKERLKAYASLLHEFIKKNQRQNISNKIIVDTIIKHLSAILEVPKSELNENSMFEDIGASQLTFITLVDTLNQDLDSSLRLQDILSARTILDVASIVTEAVPAPSSSSLRLIDVAYTLHIGRESMEERLAFSVSSIAALQEHLQEYINETTYNKHKIYTGNIDHNKQGVSNILEGNEWETYINNVITNKNYAKLAQLWLEGVVIEWQYLYNDVSPKKIGLPTYPFAKNEYWLPEPIIDKNVAIADKLHPLVHHNLSNFEEQCYRSVFTGEESFLRNHVVQGERILPGVAYVEMARAAGTLSSIRTISQIKDVVWNTPFKVVDNPKELFINLYQEEDSIAYEVYSEAQEKEILHSQGKIGTAALSALPAVDIDALKNRCSASIPKKDCYQLFENLGLSYGDSFRCIDQLYYNDKESLAVVQLQREEEAFFMHPGIMDAALQSTIGLSLNKKDGKLALPFSVGEISIYAKLPKEVYCYSRLAKDAKSADKVVRYDIDILDNAGNVLIILRDFSAIQTGKKDDGLETTSETLSMTGVWETVAVTTSFLSSPEKQILLLTQELSDFKGLLDKEMPLSDIHMLQEKASEAYYFEVFNYVKSLITSTKEYSLTILCKQEEWHTYGFIAGLLKTAQMENPKIRAKIIAVENSFFASIPNAVTLIQKEQLDKQVEVRYQQEERHIRVLKEVEIKATEASIVKEGGVYLITGGMGGLGKIFATYLDQADRVKLILTGRSALNKEKQEILNTFQQAQYISCDISDENSVKNLIKAIKENHGRLDGIIHSAGMLNDSFIINKDLAISKSVLSPKIEGTRYLDEATQSENLDFVVYFSSMAAVTGNVGQADYASANNYLDNYAVYRNLLRDKNIRSGKTYSINWPLWEEGGMHMDSESNQLMLQYGFRSLPIEEGLNVFTQILQKEYAQNVISYGDKPKILNILQANQNTNENPKESIVNVRENSTNSNAIFEKLQAYIISEIAGILKLEATQINPEKELQEYGLDSMMVTRFSNQINKEFDIELIPTVLFNYPTIAKLSEYLISKHSNKVKKKFSDLGINVIGSSEKIAKPLEDHTSSKDIALRVQTELMDLVAQTLKLNRSTMNPNKEFSEYGFDSIMVTKFSNQINEMYNIELAPTTLFNYPTIVALTSYILEEYKEKLKFSVSEENTISEEFKSSNAVKEEGNLLIKKPRRRKRNKYANVVVHNNDTSVVKHNTQGVLVDNNEVLWEEPKPKKLSPYTIPINTQGSNYPIFIIPGVVGDCIGYMGLSHSLNYDGPIYGLNVKGTLNQEDRPYTTMKEMVAHNIDQIKKIDYRGPIRLIAHSFGVLVMYAMLKEMEKEAIVIDKIIMIDGIPELIKGKISVTETIKVFLTAVNGNKDLIDVDRLSKEVVKKRKADRLPFLINKLTKTNFLKEEDYPLFERLYRITIAGVQLNYYPKEKLSYDVIAIKADDGLHKAKEFMDTDVNWGKYFNKVRLIHSPGNHFSVADKPLCNEWISKIKW
ncbi:SDR family NAD(P)-dependent oxidoreductase [Aquimarina aggregata]|uniref:SDR family NAD(P)-dependent oxidoreductase n=1 Tax=Aquimarina aggregata TaxID=1642818 RepID=UPI0024914DC0|nr:SDR family NAD(P)-dependent oxidoreductase [Aquimarina aggregata]